MTRLQVFVEYRLRPAATADTRFLFTLLHATRQDAIVETWGANEAWQRRNFDARVEEHAVSIIEVDGRPAGSLWLGKQADVIYIADVQILPELQGIGIGTAVLRGLIRQAAAREVPIALVVQQGNARARRLYERLGFKADQRDYGMGVQILRELGIRSMRLLSNNPRKLVGIEGYGLSVSEWLPLEIPASDSTRKYLKTKKEKLGHKLSSV